MSGVETNSPLEPDGISDLIALIRESADKLHADRTDRGDLKILSRTLREAAWENSHVLGSDPAAEIQKLVAQGGGDIGVSGSASVARWLIQHDLLDELRLLVYPLTQGKGQRLFDESLPTMNLRLVESHPFSTGVVSLVYRRAEPPEGADKPVKVQYAEAVKRTR